MSKITSILIQQFWKNEENKCDFDYEIEEWFNSKEYSSIGSTDEYNFTNKMVNFNIKFKGTEKLHKMNDIITPKSKNTSTLVSNLAHKDIDLDKLKSKLYIYIFLNNKLK